MNSKILFCNPRNLGVVHINLAHTSKKVARKRRSTLVAASPLPWRQKGVQSPSARLARKDLKPFALGDLLCGPGVVGLSGFRPLGGGASRPARQPEPERSNQAHVPFSRVCLTVGAPLSGMTPAIASHTVVSHVPSLIPTLARAKSLRVQGG